MACICHKIGIISFDYALLLENNMYFEILPRSIAFMRAETVSSPIALIFAPFSTSVWTNLIYPKKLTDKFALSVLLYPMIRIAIFHICVKVEQIVEFFCYEMFQRRKAIAYYL